MRLKAALIMKVSIHERQPLQITCLARHPQKEVNDGIGVLLVNANDDTSRVGL